MKLFALALDCDGTIAFNDTVDPLIVKRLRPRARAVLRCCSSPAASSTN
jgi:hypothetical protein